MLGKDNYNPGHATKNDWGGSSPNNSPRKEELNAPDQDSSMDALFDPSGNNGITEVINMARGTSKYQAVSGNMSIGAAFTCVTLATMSYSIAFANMFWIALYPHKVGAPLSLGSIFAAFGVFFFKGLSPSMVRSHFKETTERKFIGGSFIFTLGACFYFSWFDPYYSTILMLIMTVTHCMSLACFCATFVPGGLDTLIILFKKMFCCGILEMREVFAEKQPAVCNV